MGPRNYLASSKAKKTSYVNEKNKFAAAGSCGSCQGTFEAHFPAKTWNPIPPPLSSSVGGTPTVTPQYLIYVPYHTYKPSTCSHPFFVDEATILSWSTSRRCCRPRLAQRKCRPPLSRLCCCRRHRCRRRSRCDWHRYNAAGNERTNLLW